MTDGKEYSRPAVLKIAARAIRYPETLMLAEIQALAGSVLAQAPDVKPTDEVHENVTGQKDHTD